MPGIRPEMVSFAAQGGGSCTGFLARPDDDQRYPGVVVIPEFWGLVDQIKGVAQRFAADGYVAMALDLYHGEATDDRARATQLMRDLDQEQAARDTLGAMEYLSNRASGRIGIVGFCLGGAVAFQTAARSDAVGATVAFYPTVVPVDVLQAIGAPMLALYAELDTIVLPAQAEVVEKALQSRALSVETHVYPGVGHAFFNDSRPDNYDRPAAEDAWTRTLSLFRKHLV
jgi:carboxymethylenebutenolidase